MNEKIAILFRQMTLASLLILLGVLAACNLPIQSIPDTQIDDQPPPEELPPLDDEHPPDEDFPADDQDVFIEFDVERAEMHPGECTMLWWHVEGGFGVHLNGEDVEPAGEREICIEETTLFVLDVDVGREEAEVREIEINVAEFPEDEPPENDEVWIEFFAERTEVSPGECTMLFWATEGGFGAYLNGEPVEREGELEVCLDETMFFVLGVDLGEEMEAREIEIHVEGMPGDEQPSESTSSGGSTSSSTSSSSSGGTSGGTSSGGCPGAPVISSFTANPNTITAGQSSKLEWGPVTNGNTSELVGTVEIYPGVGKVGSPGSTMVSPTATTAYALTGTGCGGSTTKQVTVNVSGGGGSSGSSGGGSFSADIEPTDIYPGNQPHGQFHVRITNNGPGTINNLQITVICSTDPTDKNTGKSDPGKVSQFNVTESMKPGETHSHPTNLTLDYNTFSYVVECELKPSFTDPNMNNNKYGEGFNGVKWIGP